MNIYALLSDSSQNGLFGPKVAPLLVFALSKGKVKKAAGSNETFGIKLALWKRGTSECF